MGIMEKKKVYLLEFYPKTRSHFKFFKQDDI